MVHPQRTCSHMELLPLVCLCLLSCSGTTSADPAGRVVVEEGSDVILPCFFNGVDIDKERLEWKKNGQTVLEYDANVLKKLPDDRFSRVQDKLKLGNASIKIRNTKVADRGDYTCHILDSSHEIVHVKLVVGAAPKPSVTILRDKKTSALLQCKAHGVPDLEVHWQDSDGNKLPAEKSQVTEGGRVYITLKTTVTKTDNFTCVATQMNLSHRISAGIDIYIDEPEPQPDNTGLVVGAIVGTLLVAALVFGVVFYMREQKHKRELKEKDRIIEGSRQHTQSSPEDPAEDSALKSPA